MRQAKNNSIMLNLTKKNFNKVAKQQIFFTKTQGLRLLYPLTKKKWIFCTETTYLKILKAKDKLQAYLLPSHDSDYLARLATFNNWSKNWIIRKYRKLHIRICFARFSQIQLQQLFTGKLSIVLESMPAVVVLRYFTASDDERKICVQKDNKTIKLKLKKLKEKKLWLLLLEQQKNDRICLFFSSKLAGLL